MILSLISSIATTGLSFVGDYFKRRHAKAENEMKLAAAVTDAKIERAKTKQSGDIAWENTALAGAGIKDEVLMVVILFPMVMCFVPGGDEIVRRGFSAMSASLPDYWIHAFYALIGVSFGLRKWTDIMSIRKGE